MKDAMTYMLFAFWLAVFFAAWRLWKRVVRDMVRDSLFDLRDNWRKYWVDRKMRLDDPFYGYVRNQINAYLRYTAQWRMLDTWYIVRHLDRIEPIAREYRARNTPEPAVPDRDTAELAARIRVDSIQAMRAYMMLTSVLICPLVIIAVFAVVIKNLTWNCAILKAVNWVSNKFPAPVGDARTIESAVTFGNLASA